MADAIVLLGDQLFPDLAPLPDDLPIFMREDLGLCTRTRHHKQKIAMFLAAMRHRANDLRAEGREVIYERLRDDKKSYAESLKDTGLTKIVMLEPSDAFFVNSLLEEGIEVRTVKSPAFLTPDDAWSDYRDRYERLRMADFYALQRKRLGLLLDDDGPEGGKWSFDTENRKPWPKGAEPSAMDWPEPDDTTREVLEMVARRFPDHPGNLEPFRWPVTRRAALDALEAFLTQRFSGFGPYEDAISKDHAFLHHSTLSPAINMGLLTPKEVVDAAIEAYRDGLCELASCEGFVRQIIGWREFIKRVDDLYREDMSRIGNPLEQDRKLGPAWWTAETGIPPIDAAIRRCLDHGWCHHIERLMVLGAPMIMARVHPDEAYRWFMEMFVDSADWVMAPNVYGMSQWADGGLFATKPYVSGSAYVVKMSDWPKGDWCDVWDGLYWSFVDRNRKLFESNVRTRMTVRTLDRLKAERKERIFSAAESFIDRTTEPL